MRDPTPETPQPQCDFLSPEELGEYDSIEHEKVRDAAIWLVFNLIDSVRDGVKRDEDDYDFRFVLSDRQAVAGQFYGSAQFAAAMDLFASRKDGSAWIDHAFDLASNPDIQERVDALETSEDLPPAYEN